MKVIGSSITHFGSTASLFVLSAQFLLFLPFLQSRSRSAHLIRDAVCDGVMMVDPAAQASGTVVHSALGAALLCAALLHRPMRIHHQCEARCQCLSHPAAKVAGKRLQPVCEERSARADGDGTALRLAVCGCDMSRPPGR